MKQGFQKIPTQKTLLYLLLIVYLSACASMTKQHTPLVVEKNPITPYEDLGYSWWWFGFGLNWEADTDPAWYMDTLIAHQVVAPVLEQYKDDIELWRFHRRAMRDQAGHRFSFIFYASNQTAAKIHEALQASSVFANLLESGAVLTFNKQDFSRLKMPELEDTSDKHWSAELQKSWPYFIMGVSQTWLDLIARYDAQLAPLNDEVSLDDLRLRYEAINQRISKTWEKEGQHAFLHHLNALFGYVPIIYTERNYKSF